MLVAAACLSPVRAAWADSIQGALSKAYMGNPTLRGARAGQRSTDEQVPQALSGWRPTVSLSEQIGPIWTQTTSTSSFFKQTTTSRTSTEQSIGRIVLSQPVFNGFQTVEGTAEAKAFVKAGQQSLLATEQQVLFNAAQAYMDVWEYRRFVALQQENVKALQGQLSASNERFKVGEITRTDVAQARASLSQAKGVLETYRATLASQIATYVQIVGTDPGAINYPSLPRLPASMEQAFQTAAELNPTILAQAYTEDAYHHNIGVKRAPLLPQISLNASLQSQDDLLHAGGQQQVAQLYGQLSFSLYDGGLNYSLVRQAKQQASQQRIKVIEVARSIRQLVAASWNQLAAARANIGYSNDQVAAAQLALAGVKEEFQAGTRTTLDVLNAQQAVVTAQLTLVVAQYNQIINGFQLLDSVGKLTARDLVLNVPYYDPQENYLNTKGKWIGTGVDTVE